jgi:hypothetical protein
MVIRFKTTKKGSKSFTYEEHTWDLSKQLNTEDLLQLPEFSRFEKVASIVPANNAAGYEIVAQPKYKDKKFIIYIIDICGKTLKGGKSKNTIDSRSYPAGTEDSWTNRGTPSDTNYYWSQIFRQCLENECEVNFWGYAVPSMVTTYTSFDGKTVTEETAGHYESEEKKLNRLLKKNKGGNLIGEGKLWEKNKG